MDDACAIPLKFCAIGMARLGVFATARFARFFRKGREHGALRTFHFFARFAVRDAHFSDELLDMTKLICQRSRAC